LIEADVLVDLGYELLEGESDEQPQRYFYVSTEVARWWNDELPALVGGSQSLSPFDAAAGLIRRWVLGLDLIAEAFDRKRAEIKALRPPLIELRTADRTCPLRFIGVLVDGQATIVTVWGGRKPTGRYQEVQGIAMDRLRGLGWIGNDDENGGET
jgi:hypothetical protein